MLLSALSPSKLLFFAPVAGCCLYLLTLAAYRLFFHPLAKYPGPRIAALTDLYQTYHALRGNRHLNFAQLHEQYGPVVRFGPSSISFNSASALKDIYGFKANVRKARFYEAFWASKDAFSTHSSIDKTAHARKRRVLSHAFSDTAIKSMEPHILTSIREFCANLAPSPSPSPSPSTLKSNHGFGAPLNLGDQANYLTFDVLSALCFGESFGMLARPDHRFVIDMIGSAAHRHLICGTHLPIHEWGLDRLLFRKIAAQRAQYMEYSRARAAARSQRGPDPRDAQGVVRKDFFSHLLHARDPETGEPGFSPAELWGESNMLIIAGSDTTATALAATVFYLVHYPEVLGRLTRAVRAAFAEGSAEEGLGVEAIVAASPRLSPARLPLLRACIDEAMRLSPSVGGLLPREVLGGGLTVTVPGRGAAPVVLPAGTVVGVPHYALHHNAEYFPRPHVYDPDRWLVGARPDVTVESVERASAAFCPFSVGPRGCIGKGMAYAELSTAIARMVWLFNMRLSPTEGHVGEGRPGLGWGRERRYEFQLWDTFTSWKTGPCVEFKSREV